MEHRWGERLKVALPVRIHAASGLVGPGLVVNFSVSGAFIAATFPVPPLSRVHVSFGPRARRAGLRTHAGHSIFEAQVVRQNAAGFAVEWCEFGTDEVVAFANSNRNRVPPMHQHSSGHSAFASWKHS
jgi:PilZ domain